MSAFEPQLLHELTRPDGRARKNFATLSDARSGVAVARIVGGALLFLHLTLLPSFAGQSFLMERTRLRASTGGPGGIGALVGREFFAWGFIVAIAFSLIVMLAPLLARGTRSLAIAATAIGVLDVIAITAYPQNRLTGGGFTPSLTLGALGCAITALALFASVGDRRA